MNDCEINTLKIVWKSILKQRLDAAVAIANAVLAGKTPAAEDVARYERSTKAEDCAWAEYYKAKTSGGVAQ